MNYRLQLAIILPLLFTCTYLSGQNDLPINYQAVIRNADGTIAKNKMVGLRFSFYDSLQNSAPEYVELHEIMTTDLGYVNLELGNGQDLEGEFSNISWKSKKVYLQIEVNTGQGFTDLGITDFKAVPFSKYADAAKTSEKASNLFLNEIKDVSAPSPTVGQILRWNGETWVPSKDSDIQTLQITGRTLSISNGNQVTLPESDDMFSAGNGIDINNGIIQNTGDLNPDDDVLISHEAGGMLNGTFDNLNLNLNSIDNQHLKSNSISSSNIIDGSIQSNDFSSMGAANGQVLKWSSSSQRWIVADDEGGPKQTLSINGSTLSISDGNSVTLPNQSNYAPGIGISIQGQNIINTGDTDASDDLLKTSSFDGDVAGTYTNLKLKTGVVGESILAAGSVSNLKLSNNAVTGSKIANMGATNGQVLKWTGTTWGPANDDTGTSVWNISGSNVNNINLGNVGIGLTNPTAKLHVVGDGTTTGGIRISTPGTSNNGAALLLDGNSVDWALMATNQGFSMGGNKFVIRNQTFGNTPFILNSNGNLGLNVDDPSAKLAVSATNGETNTVNIISNTASNNSIILQTEYSGDVNAQREVTAIKAKAISGTGFGTGILAEGGNIGIKSIATGANANKPIYGLYAEATGNSGTRYGVYGAANGSTGVNINYGIYGTTSGSGFGNYAGYFQGNLHVSGTLSKSAGTFKIDHPADPENKYLIHSFVESPDMMNVYNGNISTDEKGFATVTLPDYFELLNKDFRYQLTVIGTFAQAIIKEKIKENTFVIQTSEPNVEVSWQITGIRKDPYAEKNRIEPVVEKPQGEKGTYLNPEVYNQEASKALGYPEKIK
ncbi:MAG: hypothetical protein R2879_09065 [Saprospiraceae bacterium]